jgi:hypothetical protein
MDKFRDPGGATTYIDGRRGAESDHPIFLPYCCSYCLIRFNPLISGVEEWLRHLPE